MRAGGVSGVTYATVGDQQIGCGMDSSGNALYLQVSTLAVGSPEEMGGMEVGVDIGMAILGVCALAWCFRALRDYLNRSGGDGF